ncbi:MAG: Hcp family type VI secretion system effector [Gemmataceae bacterium]
MKTFANRIRLTVDELETRAVPSTVEGNPVAQPPDCHVILYTEIENCESTECHEGTRCETTAVSEYFLDISGVEGESKDPRHKEWCEVNSVKFNVNERGNDDSASRTLGRNSNDLSRIRGNDTGTTDDPQDRSDIESSCLSDFTQDGSQPTQSDYFLKLNGVAGESTDRSVENEIEVLSWSWGETNEGTQDQSDDKDSSNFGDLTFVMRANKATPKLMQYCAEGKHITEDVVLTCLRAGETSQEYLMFEMKPVLISSYQSGGSSGENVPVDTLSLNFTKISFEYKP